MDNWINKWSITEEVRTELKTKEILSKYYPKHAQKLTPEEKSLLEYLS